MNARDHFEKCYAEDHDLTVEQVRTMRMGDSYRLPKTASVYRAFVRGWESMKSTVDIEAASNHWISVKDRLPESMRFVMAWGHSDERSDKEPRCFIAWIYFNQWREINNGDYRDGGYGDDYEAVVTHWQPLPEPPAEGE